MNSRHKQKINDGSDFQHRQRILPHYQLVGLTKQRLKFTIITHILLSGLMVAKLVPTILDMLNIFYQPIEELYIPVARTWEWIWFSSTLIALLTFKAIRTNNTLFLKLFLLSTISCCICPIVYCAYHFSADFRSFVITKDVSKTSESWRGYPVAIYWYMFIFIAGQIHGFELYFGWDLLKILNSPRSSKLANKTK